MSTWVWKHSASRGTDRLVLLAVADYASADGTDAWPSDDSLASMCQVDRTTIVRCRRRLRALGELDWISGKVTGRSNRYRVVMDRAAQEALRATVLAEEGDADCNTPRVTQDATPGVAPVQHNPLVEPPIDPSLNRDAPLALLSTAMPSTAPNDQRVFDAWIEATGKTGKTLLSDERRRLIRRALKSYPLEDVIDAVRGWRHSAYHMGDNDGHVVYNDLSLLLRNAEKIEKFRDLERGTNTAPGVRAREVPEAWNNIRTLREQRERKAGA